MDVQSIIQGLASSSRLPREALRAASAHKPELVTAFLDAFEAFLAGRPMDNRNEAQILFYAFHLFGEWREASAYRTLARFLREPPDKLESVLGDSVTETAHRIMAAVFDGQPEPLFEIILDPAASEGVRSSMCTTLAILAARGRLDRHLVENFLREGYSRIEPQSRSFVWCGWMEAIARLGFAELGPLVEQAFASGFVDPSFISFGEFREELERGLDNSGRNSWCDHRAYEDFGSTDEELENFWGISDQTGETFSEALALLVERIAERSMLRVLAQEPSFNPFRDVGRNDPCPCGSGKKYKKCCLN
jgi:Protein of unknown function (DUF1186)/SEC-C motif